MRVRYTIKSVSTPAPVPGKVDYVPVTQNTELIVKWARIFGLVPTSSEMRNNEHWCLTLEGSKTQHNRFATKLITEGSSIYSIETYKLSWWD